MRGGPTLDPAPLLAMTALGVDPVVNDFGQKHWGDPPAASVLAERLGVTRRMVVRWQGGQARIRANQADVLCTRLGVHPIEVWGIRAWNDLVAEPDDREEFAE